MSQNNPFSSGSNPNMLSSEADTNTNDIDMVTNSQRSVRSSSPLIFGSNSEIDRLRSSPPPQFRQSDLLRSNLGSNLGSNAGSMLDSQSSSRRISSSTRRMRGDMGIGPYPQLDRLLKSGGLTSDANNNQNQTSELSSEIVTTKRYIWGTTLVVAEASKMFEDFLLNFTMADRIRAMREEDPTVSIDIRPEHEQPYYFPRILKEMNELKIYNLNLNCQNLKSYKKSLPLYHQLIRYPQEIIPIMDHVLTEKLAENSEDYAPIHALVRPYNIGKSVNMRDLNPSDIDQLVTIKGLLIRVTPIIPDLQTAFFSCSNCDYSMTVDIDRGKINEPTKCPNDACRASNSMRLIHNRCIYSDKQIWRLQETPDEVPDGQTPHSVSLCCYEDLVDTAKPGDRLEITGVFRAIPVRVNPRQHTIKQLFKTYIDIVHVKHSSSKRIAIDENLIGENEAVIKHDEEDNLKYINEEEEKNLISLSQSPDIYERLAASLAPSIFGMEDVKKGVLLQLFGGVNRFTGENGSPRIRGDINVLIVGDPGVSKSQLLQYVHKIAPRGIYTSGKGSSAVGLTASVTRDPETRQLVLESGALVLSDGGVCCIDEFDKMTDSDRVAIHEVMEQQTVTIAKAGIHTSLNARCSVVAAANPIYGRYDDRKRPFENIALPDSLLSRFDMLFIVLDDINETRDREIAEHVLRVHRFNNNNEDGTPVDDSNMTIFNNTDPNENEDQETPVWEKSTQYINTGRKQTRKNAILSIPFIKKYIQYAKLRIHPTLTQEAVDIISDAYVDLRSAPEGRDAQGNGSFYKTLPVTARTLETLIRLATAHAKARLSNTVQAKDAKVAKEMMRYVLWKDVKERERRKKRRRINNNEAESDEESSEEEDSEEEVPLSDIKSKVNGGNVEDQRMGETVSQFSEISISNPSEASSSQAISPERLDLFRRQLNILKSDGTDSFEISQLIGQINGSIPADQQFSQTEIQSALQIMSDNNQIFFSENVVYIV